MTENAEDDERDDGEDESNHTRHANRLETQLPGIEIKTQLADGDVEELEAVHRRQLEWALEHADEAKESTRI